MVRSSYHEQGILAVILVLLSSAVALSGKRVNVLDYGAVGDGSTDDSHAFLRAWDVTCNFAFVDSASMIIPWGMKFLVNPITFKGPCKPAEVNFKIFGTIISPKETKAWKGIDSGQWLTFGNVSGLVVDGNGIINGQGTDWWSKSCRNNHTMGCKKKAPTAMKLLSCHKSYLRNLHFINSASTHIAIFNSEWFHVSNVQIKAPKNSPNTDGIHIRGSKHVSIDSSTMSSGDDCISIGDNTSDVRITNINCGPGHGISVGSLGKGGSNVKVENIRVSYVNFYQTTNGARIKTWKGATGYARGITFEHLNFTDVKNPIIIDQYYCNHFYPRSCEAVEKSGSGVQISDVTYKNATGTSSTEVAIRLNCGKSIACSGILLDSIRLSSTLHSRRHHYKRATSSCTNAHGRTKGVIQPNIPCLVHEYSRQPVEAE